MKLWKKREIGNKNALMLQMDGIYGKSLFSYLRRLSSDANRILFT